MPKPEPLDTSNLRYWRQNAQMAIRDVYDALIEVITNADDRYMFLGAKEGRIEIEIERRRKGSCSIIKVRDFADGMTLDVMKNKIKRVGDRVSGLAEGQSVRGTNSRGAKDIAILGGVTFESIAADKSYHKCEVTSQGQFIPYDSCPKESSLFSADLKIPHGTGTVVTIQVDPGVVQVPQHETLCQNLCQLVALRDIIGSPQRELVLYDVNMGRKDVLKVPVLVGEERVSERFSVPGYAGAEAKIIIFRSKERLQDQRPRFRRGGILVKSKHAIHEATLFAPELENDPHAQWFYGRLTCEFIDRLWNDFDDYFEKGLPPSRENPRPIIDPMRKEGLSREHPFVDALFKEALKRLRPLVEEARKQAESHQARIESEDTKRRLRALEKAAAKFMSEQQQSEEPSRDPDGAPDSTLNKKGYSLNPPFAQIVLGQSVRFWLNINQATFPELTVADLVEISCASDEITCSKRFEALQAHPKREGILRCVWTVKGAKPTKATEVKVRVGPIVAESVVEVLQSERDRFAEIKDFAFSHQRYTVHAQGVRRIYIYAPSPALISARTPVVVTCSDTHFKVSGEHFLVPRPEWGIAVCELCVRSSQPDRCALLIASAVGHKCEAEVRSVTPPGAGIQIEIKDCEFGNQRYFWRPGNVLQIGARHPSLRRYLGPEFKGQEDKPFRVLVAEIVAEAVCSLIMSHTERDDPSTYSDFDWDAYYAEYSRLMTQFLPIAHETQVKV